MNAATAAVRRMEAAGFKLEAHGGTLHVAPAERLNQTQRRWLARNQPALLATLAALQLPDVQQLVEQFGATIISAKIDSQTLTF